MEILLRIRLIAFLLGLLGFFVSERYLESEAFHWILTGLSLGFMVAGLGITVTGMWSAKKRGYVGETRSWWMIVLWKSLVLVGAAAYLGYAYLMGNSASPDTLLEQAMLALWLLALVIGVFAGIGAELAFAGSGRGGAAEPRRIRRSCLNWSMVGMLLGVLTCFNYAVAKKDKVWDWSYLKTTTPSDSTIAMVDSSSAPIDVAVFYPYDNEVLPYIKEYFDYLKNKSDKVKVAYYDKDIHPTKAEDFKASRNGQVVLQFKDLRERIDIGDDLKSARGTLKKLDSEVQKVVLRLAQEKKRLYFTRGHGEMSWIGQKDPLRSIELLEKVLRSQNYSLRLFGVGEGSASAVPDDATAVVIAGPTEPFMQAEADALAAYLDKGGKLFVLLDVAKSLHDTEEITSTPNDPLQIMLAKRGIKFNKQTLGNESNNIGATRSPADVWFIYSNTFSTHESVSNLARNEERVALLMFQAGHFDVTERSEKWKGYTTVRSMSDTFADGNKNYAFDKAETKKTFSLGAAATMDVPAKDGGKDDQARILALADANAISDALIRNRGNAIFTLDSIRWLAGQAEFSGETSSEEDVKIQHTRKEDAVWFNLTVAVVPLFVLGTGYLATRRKRRKGK